MIRPSQAWCVQIEVTNACHLHCSNCTRMLDHARTRFFMSIPEFAKAVEAVKDWPNESERDLQGRGKVIGIMGGEPLLHPSFPTFVDILVNAVPNVANRGLWTSLDWRTYKHPKYGFAKPHVERLVGPHEKNGRGGGGGWLNWNLHTDSMRVHHQPVLVSSRDLIPDEKKRWETIENCWLQRSWSPAATHKGFFFCEVAAAMDIVFNGPGGLPLEPGVWRGELKFERDAKGVPRPVGPFASQIYNSCEDCGICIPMPGRRDNEEVDDVSPSNLIRLEQINSPRLAKGRVNVVQSAPGAVKNWAPRQYVKGSR